jgi:hypothetical protein
VYSGTCGALSVTGPGCAGSGGFVPALMVDGCPTPGGHLTLGAAGALGGAPALLLFGPVPAALPLKGCILSVAPPFAQLLLVLPGSGHGGGAFTAQAVLPQGTSGLTLALQLLIADAAGPSGLSATNGMVIQVP